MNSKQHAFGVESGVNWPVAASAVAAKYQWAATTLDSATGPAAATSYIDTVVCSAAKPYPVIVGVQGTDKSHFPSHFVLVMGKQFDAAGNVTHPIADPYSGSGKTTLENYGHFVTRGFVKDPTDDLSVLSINVGSNASILLTDPNGNKTGTDTQGNEIDNIPLSTHYDDAIADDLTGEAVDGVDHFINLFQPAAGTYLLQISGLELGSFDGSVQMISTDGTLQKAEAMSGQVEQGSVATYRITVSPTPGSIPTVAAILGDVNGDGQVNCSDLDIVKVSFGKSTGQAGFDARADVNHDGIVNILDLSIVARQLPAGTVCR
jgi:hypothetical protein